MKDLKITIADLEAKRDKALCGPWKEIEQLGFANLSSDENCLVDYLWAKALIAEEEERPFHEFSLFPLNVKYHVRYRVIQEHWRAYIHAIKFGMSFDENQVKDMTDDEWDQVMDFKIELKASYKPRKKAKKPLKTTPVLIDNADDDLDDAYERGEELYNEYMDSLD